MKISDYRQFELEFDCQEVQELLFLYVLDRGDLSLDERWAIERHLDSCTDCQKEYEHTKFVNDALIANRDYLVQEGVFEKPKPEAKFKRVPDDEVDFLQFQAKMQRAIARRKKAERQDKWICSKFVIKISSIVAACLIAAIGLYLTVSQLTSTQNASIPTFAVQPPKGSVKIELLIDSGAQTIQASQPIIAASKLKTLRINDNRQMILNVGTELSIVPHNLGCIVKLNKGEIYTEVEHDGKPFIVETAHGRAVITGTTFNINADDKQMELIVAEGTVSFNNDKGSVNVAAGHKSLLASNVRPLRPTLCDTRQLTAWATGINDLQEIATTTSYESEIVLTPMFGSEPLDLGTIDYDSWVKEKRDWFKRESPHIFKLKEALAKDGIEVDYPKLLIKSGDLWRFEYPAKSNTQLVSVSEKSLLNLASNYGKDKQWLLSNVGAIGSFNPVGKTSLDALDKWADAVNGDMQQANSDILLYSFHASVYLTETRTLAWLMVNNGMTAVKTCDKAELLSLLEKEVESAYSCVTQNKRLLVEDHKVSACDESGCRKLLQAVVENIEEITDIEKKIAKYEVTSK